MDWQIRAQLDRSTWTDITDRVMAMQVTRGRQNDQSTTEAGRLELTVLNSDSQYTVDNTNSPLEKWGRRNLVTNPRVNSTMKVNHVTNPSFEYGSYTSSGPLEINNSTYTFFLARSGQWPEDPPVDDTTRPYYARIHNIPMSHTSTDVTVLDTGNVGGGIDSNPVILGGNTYKFTCKIATSGGGSNAQVRAVAYWTPTATDILTGAWQTIGENSWATLTLPNIVPPGVTTGRILIRIQWQNLVSTLNTGMALLLDDLCICDQTSTSYEYFDGDTPGFMWVSRLDSLFASYSVNQPICTDASGVGKWSVTTSVALPSGVICGPNVAAITSRTGTVDGSLKFKRGWSISPSKQKRDFTFSFWYKTEFYEQRLAFNGVPAKGSDGSLPELPLTLQLVAFKKDETLTVALGNPIPTYVSATSRVDNYTQTLLQQSLPINDGVWQRARYSFTIEDESIIGVMAICATSIGSYATPVPRGIVYVAAVALAETDSLTDYFDGSNTGATWTGDSNASESMLLEYDAWDVGLPIQVRVDVGDGYQSYFQGSVKSITNTYDVQDRAYTSKLVCYDVLDALQQLSVGGFDISYAQELLSPWVWWKLDDAIGNRLRVNYSKSSAEFRQRYGRSSNLVSNADFIVPSYVETIQDLQANPRMEFGQAQLSPGLSKSLKITHRANKEAARATLTDSLESFIVNTGATVGPRLTISGFFSVSNVTAGNTYLIRLDTGKSRGTSVTFRPQINAYATIAAGVISIVYASSGVDSTLTPVTTTLTTSTSLKEDTWFALDIVVGAYVPANAGAPVSIYINGILANTSTNGYRVNLDLSGTDSSTSYLRMLSAPGSVVTSSDLALYRASGGLSAKGQTNTIQAVSDRIITQGW